jgi:Copine
VGGILENYDYDKSFPVYGFGGIPKHMQQNTTNHCFAMNGRPDAPQINNVTGILAEYRRTLPAIKLSGPTLFAPVLREFTQYVAQFAN